MKIPPIEELDYFTKRTLANDKGEKKGRVVMYRVRGEEEFHYMMVCPYCGKEQKGKASFKRRPYRIECEGCGKKVLVERLLKKKKK